MKEKVENHSAKESRLSKCLYNVLDLFCEIVRDLVRWFWRIVDFFNNMWYNPINIYGIPYIIFEGKWS